MYLFDTGTIDPYLNIASEEYFFRNNNDDLVLIYINSPSVIVGKHQNVFEEINYRFIIENNIPVIRRISGGGTVYHDHGNINFTFIRNAEYGKQVDFKRFIEPINIFFRERGLDPEVGEKNEIRVDGLKFSGNAEHLFRNRILHHGTILFSSDMKNLRESLRKGDAIFRSRSVQSNRTSVGNLAGHLPLIESTDSLKAELESFLLSYFPDSVMRKPGIEETESIIKLADEKYHRWEWNYGYGPAYEITNNVIISGLQCQVSMSVERGIVTVCTISGQDRFKTLPIMFKGVPHRLADFAAVFKKANIEIDTNNLYRFFW